ncbi:hypothetical protein C8T65DRAFT_743651 [Cerioporus squamosus]|nr:hypothetical protein C8T65DRAFT_743651 [Cerioporus squamosus]
MSATPPSVISISDDDSDIVVADAVQHAADDWDAEPGSPPIVISDDDDEPVKLENESPISGSDMEVDDFEANDFVTLENAKDFFLTPFHNHFATQYRWDPVFSLNGRGQFTRRYLLCHRRQNPTPPGRRRHLPIAWDLIGQFSPEDFWFLGFGHSIKPGTRSSDPDPVASFWLQPRPHAASLLNWRGVQESVQAIADLEDGEVNTSHLFRLNDEGLPEIQIFWQGYPDETIVRNAPFFNQHGDRDMPMKAEDVPWTSALHVVFTIDLFNDTRDGRKILTAQLTRACIA